MFPSAVAPGWHHCYLCAVEVEICGEADGKGPLRTAGPVWQHEAELNGSRETCDCVQESVSVFQQRAARDLL